MDQRGCTIEETVEDSPRYETVIFISNSLLEKLSSNVRLPGARTNVGDHPDTGGGGEPKPVREGYSISRRGNQIFRVSAATPSLGRNRGLRPPTPAAFRLAFRVAAAPCDGWPKPPEGGTPNGGQCQRAPTGPPRIRRHGVPPPL